MIDGFKAREGDCSIELDRDQVIVNNSNIVAVVSKELFMYVARQIVELDNMKREKAND